jgi:LmbE family N-acetylglucosaminyl deacetylase
MTRDLPVPARALAIAAHPDDVEFGAGATLAKWAAHGCSVLHVICTDGAKGSWDPGEDEASLVLARQAEQRAASIALGASGDVEFLGWPDGELESGVRQRYQIAAAIRSFRPDVVLGHDPWKRYRIHPDHRHAGFLAVEGIVAARDPHFFPDLALAHHRPTALLLFEADDVNHIETAAPSAMESKVAALLAHRSQFRSTMEIDDPSSTTAIEAFRQRVIAEATRAVTEAGGDAAAGTAEAFHLMTDL